MPEAKVSTTEVLDLVLDVSRLAAQVKMIEDTYHISVQRFAGEYHEESTKAVFHGLDENIRIFIQDQEGVAGEEVDRYIAETEVKEIPFWNVGVMIDYLTALGWKSQVSSSSKVALMENRGRFTLTKFASPNKAVVVELPVFSPDPEEVTVYVVNNDDADFAPGEQFIKPSPLHRVDFAQVVTVAEKFLSTP
jgi:hypothetical protein